MYTLHQCLKLLTFIVAELANRLRPSILCLLSTSKTTSRQSVHKRANQSPCNVGGNIWIPQNLRQFVEDLSGSTVTTATAVPKVLRFIREQVSASDADRDRL